MAKTTSTTTTRKASGRVKASTSSSRTKAKTDDGPVVAGQNEDESLDAEGTGGKSGEGRPRRVKKTDVVGPSGDGESAPSGDRAATRRQLIDTTFEKITGLLEGEGNVSQATINSVVQLLKLERELTEDEPPHEIRVVWQDTEKVSSDG